MAGRKVRATFTIDAELKQRLDRMVPSRKRSEFVEKSIAETLGNAHREAVLDLLEKIPPWRSRHWRFNGVSPAQAARVGWPASRSPARPQVLIVPDTLLADWRS